MRRQLVRVLGHDLRERAMPVAAVVAAIGQPLGGVLETVEQILRGHLRRGRLCRQRDRRDDDDQQSAHNSPQSEIRNPHYDYFTAISAPRSVVRYPTRSFKSFSLIRPGPK